MNEWNTLFLNCKLYKGKEYGNLVFYDAQGNKYGPNDDAQIRALVQRGVIIPSTRLVDSIGRQGLAWQIPGLFPNYNPRDPNQYDEEEEQSYDNGGSGAVMLLLGVSTVASILTFIIGMVGINAFQKASFYARHRGVADSMLDAAWRTHLYFNGWALTGSIIAAIVVFGVAFLITWLVIKRKS